MKAMKEIEDMESPRRLDERLKKVEDDLVATTSAISFVKIDKLAKIPKRATTGSIGYDIFSIEEVTIAPGTMVRVKTGLNVSLPPEITLDIRPRSSLIEKLLFIPNSPGTIDSDYRGEVKVQLFNLGSVDATIAVGQRIAQFVPVAVPMIKWIEVEKLAQATRQGGFGSTGE